MSLPDLSEVGPDDERWWAMTIIDSVDGKPYDGYSHELLFMSLICMTNRLTRENAYAAKFHCKTRQQAFLADSRPLIRPYVSYTGCSVWENPEDDITPDDEDDVIDDEDPF